MPMSNSSKSDGKEEHLLTAFEVVQTILGFGSFTIALIGLCYKIFKDNDKKK
ncbi:TPA: putative holin-like toxin [Streptococcus suis]|nr:putative holin-like toxin [Streptococcus agalactiae]HEM4762516.1 putative holin-like toxin [Streptococcus suis]